MSEPTNSPTLIAYKIHDYPSMPIVPADVQRDWMNRTNERFAYRCLPLNIANQHGWFLLNTHKIRCVWNGRDTHDAVTIICKAGPRETPCPAISHFGSASSPSTSTISFARRRATTSGAAARQTFRKTASSPWKASSKPTGPSRRSP
jgi:hypothetical protein